LNLIDLPKQTKLATLSRFRGQHRRSATDTRPRQLSMRYKRIRVCCAHYTRSEGDIVIGCISVLVGWLTGWLARWLN